MKCNATKCQEVENAPPMMEDSVNLCSGGAIMADLGCGLGDGSQTKISEFALIKQKPPSSLNCMSHPPSEAKPPTRGSARFLSIFLNFVVSHKSAETRANPFGESLSRSACQPSSEARRGARLCANKAAPSAANTQPFQRKY